MGAPTAFIEFEPSKVHGQEKIYFAPQRRPGGGTCRLAKNPNATKREHEESAAPIGAAPDADHVFANFSSKRANRRTHAPQTAFAIENRRGPVIFHSRPPGWAGAGASLSHRPVERQTPRLEANETFGGGVNMQRWRRARSACG